MEKPEIMDKREKEFIIDDNFRKALIMMINGTNSQYVPLVESDRVIVEPHFWFGVSDPMCMCLTILTWQKKIADLNFKYVDFDYKINIGGSSDITFKFKD